MGLKLSDIQINFCIEILPKFHYPLVECMGRQKQLTLKTPIFGNFWGSEVVGSSSDQKNIGAKFTHLDIPSWCKEFFVMRHNLGHPSE